MSRIRWPELMRLGIRDLGLSPEAFWALTPAELMLIAGAEAGGNTMTRGGFEALMRAWPDASREGGPDG